MAMALAVWSTGCAGDGEAQFDGADPIGCLVIFGMAANAAGRTAQPGMARQMVGRASFLAEQNGGAAWIRQVTPRARALAARMEAARDERATLKLLDDCVARQDADPAIPAARRR